MVLQILNMLKIYAHSEVHGVRPRKRASQASPADIGIGEARPTIISGAAFGQRPVSFGHSQPTPGLS